MLLAFQRIGNSCQILSAYILLYSWQKADEKDPTAAPGPGWSEQAQQCPFHEPDLAASATGELEI